jgi:putative radical SAM enzyme (TIGR03279 family)
MPRAARGGCVSQIAAHSLGQRADLRPGDIIHSVNGHALRDVIDFNFYTAEPALDLVVERDGERLRVSAERRFGEAIGVEFAHPTFDVDIRRCANRCDFCFVTQTPCGMRSGLYVKDDDYRYSFLFGQFVTLTNLSEADWQRIAEQHLSPLHVSVHATEPDLRGQLLGRRGPSDVLAQLRRLIAAGIQVHTQLVLIPGRNDGIHLTRSLNDLVALYPGVQSVSVVPVGLTRRHAPGLRSYRPDEARRLLDAVEPWRARCRRELGVTLVYPSDEWYLLAGRDIPPAAAYDGFQQLENGVGIVRRFMDDWATVKARLMAEGRQSRRAVRRGGWRRRGVEPAAGAMRGCAAVVVCGELAAPVLEPVCAELTTLLRTRIELRPVVNRWYGGGVTVSGLLTARDVVAQLAEVTSPADRVLLPRVMFDAAGRVTLDDMTPETIQATLGRPVVVAASPSEMVAALSE